jgi:hypothetical protein
LLSGLSFAGIIKPGRKKLEKNKTNYDPFNPLAPTIFLADIWWWYGGV